MKLRYDSDGLWWTTPPPDPTSRSRAPRRLAPIPETGWTPPKALPSLTGVRCISLDTETFDPELRDHGPGWGRGVGHVVGLSIATGPATAWYFPIRHTVQPELNLDPDHVLAWARAELPKVKHIIGANLMYDIGWLAEEGVVFPRSTRFYDVQVAEPLLDDTARSYSLDAIAARRLGDQKVTMDLYRWASRSYGGPPTPKQRENIYRCPPCLVGPYAEADAYLPWRIMEQQYPQLQREGLADLFDMESRLLPLLIDMRRRGVRVDVGRAEQVREELEANATTLQAQLNQAAGFDVSVNNAGDTLTKLFDARGVQYPYTEKGAPSFTADWLAALGPALPEAQLVTEIRRLEKMRSTFIEGYILGAQVNGRLHGQFHPLRSDEGGAVSGRFSSSTPNLQNIPARDPVYGPLIRGLFLPDEGFVQWRKIDYSQIEYRFFAHFSGDAELIQAYRNPDTDFHVVAGQMLGGKLPRGVVKTFNFMTLYGGGPGKLGEMLSGLMDEEGARLLMDDVVHELGTDRPTGEVFYSLAQQVQALYRVRFPAAKRLGDRCTREAEDTGMVRTVLGRVNRFPYYVPRYSSGDVRPLPLDQARQAYGTKLERAYTHKALNRKLQGSAADLMKKAMLDCYESGLYDYLGIPHLTVHDETDHSDPNPDDPVWKELTHTMENCLPLRVPIRVEHATGPDWGHLEE